MSNTRRISGEASPHKDDNNESEPVTIAYVRIDGDDIEKEHGEAKLMPRDLFVSGIEVRSKVRCGSYRMGYSLFYGVYEFFCEKVLFAF